MRQFNFVLIFALCLAIALFSIENTQPTMIRLVPGLQIQAPLAIALILAMGVGATVAWMFSLWSGLQSQVTIFRAKRELRNKDKQIANLEQNLAQFQTELEKQRQLMPAAAQAESVEEIEEAEIVTH